MTKIYEALELAAKQRVAQPHRTPEVAPAAAPEPQPKIQKLTRSSVPAPFELHLEETMTALYNSISAMLPGPKGRTVELIGPHRGTGTSTLIREFAKVVAVRFKKAVLLLDADYHQPTQVSQFSIEQEYGWDSALDDGRKIEPILCPVEGSSLSVSQILMQQSEQPILFDTPQFNGMINRLRESFDLILIDAPPANEHAEGIALASKVDGVVIVVEAEKTRWQAAQNTQERLEQAGANILGSVLNKRRYHIPSPIYKLL